MRKAPDLWRRWAVGMGIGLHRLQLMIAMKACELLQVGGKLVYSTCSLNPIENEAVVAEILRRTKGSFELLDVSNQLPELKRRPGMKTWRVKSRDGWVESFQDMDDDTKKKSKLFQSMFPDEASDAMPLERTCRIVPHDDNTGGFFVSVLVKTGPYPLKKEAALPELPENPFYAEEEGKKKAAETVAKSEEKTEEKPATNTSNSERKPTNSRWKGVDPVVRIDDEKIQQSLRDFFGIESSSFDMSKNFITRTPLGSKPKRLYLVSDSIRKILDADQNSRIKITSVGVKIFEKQSSPNVKVAYRISQEGLPAVLPLVSKQVFRPTLDEFRLLLEKRTLVINDAPPGIEEVMDAEPSSPPPAPPAAAEGGEEVKKEEEEVKKEEGAVLTGYIKNPFMLERPSLKDEETMRQLKSVYMGCCIAMMRDEDAERLGLVFDGVPFAITCWRGKISINLLTTKNETAQLLEKFQDLIPPEGTDSGKE